MSRIIIEKQKRENIAKFVLERLNEGDEDSEIAKQIEVIFGAEIQIGNTVGLVRTITKELIAQNKTSKEKIAEEREKRRTSERRIGIPLTAKTKEDIEGKILIRLKKGEKTSGQILANLFNISQPTADKLKKKVMKDNGIMQEEVEKARNERKRAEDIYLGIIERRSHSSIARKANADIDTVVEVEKRMYENGLDKSMTLDLALQVIQEILTDSSNKKTSITESDQSPIIETRDKENDETEQHNYEKRRAKISQMLSFRADVDVNLIEEHLEDIKRRVRTRKVSKKDIEFLQKAILMDEKLIVPKNVNFILYYYTRGRSSAPALRFIDECMQSLSSKDKRIRRAFKSKGRSSKNKSERRKK